MKFHSATAAAVTFTAAGFIVAGCSTNSGSSATASATTPVASSAATASSAAQAGSQPASPPPSQPAQAAGSATCQATNLSYALGAATGTSAQRTQVVNLTNKGSSACTLDGFPGVDLAGTANGQQDYTWSLERQSASYSTVRLQPGETAHFGLIYLPGTSASTDITVTKLVMTPPNDYTQAELTWNQSVVLQDGATHPGTYITPVVAGS
jgi:Domain of unknown function (DUF4232)